MSKNSELTIPLPYNHLFIYKFSQEKRKNQRKKGINGINGKLMELMEINCKWWKIMELEENICKYWKSPNIEATITAVQ